MIGAAMEDQVARALTQRLAGDPLFTIDDRSESLNGARTEFMKLAKASMSEEERRVISCPMPEPGDFSRGAEAHALLLVGGGRRIPTDTLIGGVRGTLSLVLVPFTFGQSAPGVGAGAGPGLGSCTKTIAFCLVDLETRRTLWFHRQKGSWDLRSATEADAIVVRALRDLGLTISE